MVAEPGVKSLETLVRIQKLARDLGIEKKLVLILNKSRNATQERKTIFETLGEIPFLGAIPFDERFIQADCEGISILEMNGSNDLIDIFKGSLQKGINNDG